MENEMEEEAYYEEDAGEDTDFSNTKYGSILRRVSSVQEAKSNEIDDLGDTEEDIMGYTTTIDIEQEEGDEEEDTRKPRLSLIFEETDSSKLLTINSEETGMKIDETGLGDSCKGPSKDTATVPKKVPSEDIIKTALERQGLLNPFTLKRVYGRLDSIPAISLTGIYKSHILYASSNVVVIYDYVENKQRCLSGHRNKITCIQLEPEGRYIVTSDAGPRSLIIIWEILTGKPLRFFTKSHGGHGCVFACFTGVDFVIASVGAEDPTKDRQTISFWSFDPSKDPQTTPIVSGTFPKIPGNRQVTEIAFSSERADFFVATSDSCIVLGTWVCEETGDFLDFHKPKFRKASIAKYKGFRNSLWMKKGEWIATSTGSGLILIWGAPIVLGLDEPPDPNRNIKEYVRNFKACETGITVFKLLMEYVVVGDENGIVHFFDHDFRLLRWCNHFNLPTIRSVSFSKVDDFPDFKELMREKYNRGDTKYPTKYKNSKVREYTRGGSKFRKASQTTIPRPPMSCPDFILGVAGGDVYYYHFNEDQVDRIVTGSPGSFVACDVCPGSNHVAYVTEKAELQMYDFKAHELIFSDKIFAGNALITTMRFHPLGQICAFGLHDGRMSFRWNYTWKTAMAPVMLTTFPIVRMVFSVDGLHLAYHDNHHTIIVIKYLPKGKGWMNLGKSRIHHMSIVDLQFFNDPAHKCNRLYSLSNDRHLIEYNVDKSSEETGLFVVKITCLEQISSPTAMVFDGPREFGIDCVTFTNDLNKVRIFSLIDEKVKRTVCSPVFTSGDKIQRLVSFPAQLNGDREKKFILYVVKGELGFMDPPLDGNPYRYTSVYTHADGILDLAVIPAHELVFTIGKNDCSSFIFQASPKAAEASVFMGGTGMTPFYRNVQSYWGDEGEGVVKDIDMLFFFLNVRRIDKQADLYTLNRNIRISEIPVVCRACGFYPTEYDLGLMMEEVRRAKTQEHLYSDDLTTEISFDDFLKVFLNHYYAVTETDVEEAFKALGIYEPKKVRPHPTVEQPYICRQDMVKYLTSEGEKIEPEIFPVYFESMYEEPHPGEFGAVKCVLESKVGRVSLSSSSSSFSSQIDEKEPVEGETPEVPSSPSSSSSSLSEVDEEEEEEEMEEVEKGQISNIGSEDDKERRDSEERPSLDDEEPPQIPRNKHKRSTIPEPPEIEETEEVEEEQVIPEEIVLDTESDIAEESVIEVDEPEPKDLVDLPERINLGHFMMTMFPPDARQPLKWEKKEEQPKEEAVVSDGHRGTKCHTIFPEAIDPLNPISKKTLATAYADYYLQHESFVTTGEGNGEQDDLPEDVCHLDQGESEQLLAASKTAVYTFEPVPSECEILPKFEEDSESQILTVTESFESIGQEMFETEHEEEEEEEQEERMRKEKSLEHDMEFEHEEEEEEDEYEEEEEYYGEEHEEGEEEEEGEEHHPPDQSSGDKEESEEDESSSDKKKEDEEQDSPQTQTYKDKKKTWEEIDDDDDFSDDDDAVMGSETKRRHKSGSSKGRKSGGSGPSGGGRTSASTGRERPSTARTEDAVPPLASEDEGTYSPPFTPTDRPTSTQTGGGGGAESDATEMTDVENPFGEEDTQFIKRMSQK